MKLEEQCCTLEQAKRLKELGANYESQFYFVNTSEIWHKDTIGMDWIVDGLAFPAYTVAELGEMLPKSIEYTCEEEQSIFIQKDRKLHAYLYWIGSANQIEYNKGGGGRFAAATAPTEAQSRAVMLIYLLENNLIPNS